MATKHSKSFNIGVVSAVLAGAFVIFLNIGSTLDSWDAISNRFPKLQEFVTTNSTPLLITCTTLLVVALILTLWDNKRLKIKLESKLTTDKVRKLVLFLSPCPEGSFYLQHFSRLLKEAAGRANANLEILLTSYCPQEAFAGTDPECLEEAVKMFPGTVSGIFMIPANPDRVAHRKRIKRFKDNYPATVLLDVYPGLIADDKFPDFAGGDEIEGGAVAARLAIDYLIKKDQKPISVLILKGRSTQWELQRILSFEEVLKGRFGADITFTTTGDLNYSKDEARKNIELEINKCISGWHQPGKKKPSAVCMGFDIIYACNDDMAIGALEAITRADERLFKTIPKIIGYDGTDEMKNLLGSGNPHILGTVEVHIAEQARRAMDAMLRLLNGDRPNERMSLVKPTAVYPMKRPRY